MTRIAAHLVVDVPAERCQAAVQEALADERLHAAYRALRPGKEYAGRVVGVKPGRWLEIACAALEPVTNARVHRLGWRVLYDFTPLADGRTRVEVAVEYGWIAAFAAAGLLRAQAENEIAHRLAAMHALERGMRAGAEGARVPPAVAAPATPPAALAPDAPGAPTLPVPVPGRHHPVAARVDD